MTPTNAAALLAWFDRHRRDLPWRRSTDPYRIWLSEVMLQQTRVETVLPYYERFLSLFPTVDALAAAPLDDVLAAWSGLGYYRRARQLHAAACQIVSAAAFPCTPQELRRLPGIGEYTAAAVASIAFRVVVPVLDGNVERVLSRFLGLAEDPKLRSPRARLMAAGAALLDPLRPGDSNQALMELGATLCSPQRPKCLLCPLHGDCVAAAEGEPERYPVARPRRPAEKLRLLVAVVAGSGRHPGSTDAISGAGDGMGAGDEDRERPVLLFRRPEGEGLLAGTWELPWLEVAAAGSGGDGAEGAEGGEGEAKAGGGAEEDRNGVVAVKADVVAAVRRASAAGLARKYGGRWELAAPVATVRHGITYRDLEVAVCQARWQVDEVGEEGGEVAWGWYDAGQRRGVPMSSLVGKVLRALSRAVPSEAGD